jgi:hypothetical protein
MFKQLAKFFLSLSKDQHLWVVIIDKEAVLGTFKPQDAIEFAAHYNTRTGKDKASVSKIELIIT